MALNGYLAQVQALLQNPPAPTSLYSTASLTSFINTARGQIAADGQCIRDLTTLLTTTNQRTSSFAQISVGSGIQGVLNVRMITIDVGGGVIFLNTYPWEWFNRYYMTVGTVGPPTVWAQYGEGAAGLIAWSPIPDTGYTCQVDAVCYPVALVSDATPEAIPYPWTDCVQFFAAYLALLSSQSNARQADAARMWSMYLEFVERARRMSTATVLPMKYPKAGLVHPRAAQGAVG